MCTVRLLIESYLILNLRVSRGFVSVRDDETRCMLEFRSISMSREISINDEIYIAN